MAFAIATSAAAVIAVAACVGDDPGPGSTPAVDSGPGSGNDASDSSTGVDSGAEAAVDAGRCNPSAPFGAPVQLVELSSSSNKDEQSPALTEDENRIYFVSNRDGRDRIFYADRLATGLFGTPVRLDNLVGNSINGDAYVERVSITKDEKALYFGWSTDGLQEFKIWVALRASSSGPPVFGTPTLVSGITEPQAFGAPFINADGTRLYYSAETASGSNLFELHSVECTTPAQCGTRRSFPALGTTEPFGEGHPVLTRDEKTMFFASSRDGGNAKTAIYVTTRSDVNGVFAAPELVLSVRPSNASPGWLSADGCRLYVASNQNGNLDIYLMTRPP